MMPVSLSIAGIEKVKTDFKTAAARALAAGFKVVEIHAAHGYLINQFLSPLTNKRTDAYGSSFENRIRLLVEIIDEVNKVWPADLPLFVRISATEWLADGWNVDDSVKLAVVLKSKGVDVIDCSSGANMPHVKIPVEPGYQVQFAEKIKREANIATAAVGLITTAAQAEKILADGQADFIFLARQFLREPYFALHAGKELDVDVQWPEQYERAK
jgi:2,4-dienoyl-CoA reductase-like NADH-dependent reductase (Old Yellow Enzyme family)